MKIIGKRRRIDLQSLEGDIHVLLQVLDCDLIKKKNYTRKFKRKNALQS